MSDESKAALTICGIVVGLFVLIGLLCFFCGKKQCYEQFAKYDPLFGMYSGCMVHYKGEYIPADNMRVM